MSVLFRAFDEMDLTKPYAAAPDSSYFGDLIEDLELVEQEIAIHDRSQLRLVKTALRWTSASKPARPPWSTASRAAFTSATPTRRSRRTVPS